VSGWRTASLDDLPRVPGPGTLTWLPVRAELGITAFGTNAYVAGAAGEHVVEPHDERRGGHQELYFVARGRARFTLDGEELVADAGTYVFIEDPGVRREAVADEAGTTVLSVGAPPGRAYTVSSWEPRFRAAAIAGEDPQGARALLEEAVAIEPRYAWAHYDLACWHARFGAAADAVASLVRAVELGGDPVRAAAREDGDFDALRDDAGFRALAGP
jgi:hypothetical protein